MRQHGLLSSQAYSGQMRKGWRGYTFAATLETVCHARDGKAMIKLLMPELSSAQHADLAEKHAAAWIKKDAAWSRLVNRAFAEVFGRAFEVRDYKVSCIAREEFTEQTKERLRKLALDSGKHHRLAIFHKMAAGVGHRGAIQFCRAFEQLQ